MMMMMMMNDQIKTVIFHYEMMLSTLSHKGKSIS